jgi:hypothetical protein
VNEGKTRLLIVTVDLFGDSYVEYQRKTGRVFAKTPPASTDENNRRESLTSRRYSREWFVSNVRPIDVFLIGRWGCSLRITSPREKARRVRPVTILDRFHFVITRKCVGLAESQARISQMIDRDDQAGITGRRIER